jgi:hypothetical protein
MNFVFAIVIGLVIGGIGGLILRSRNANAIWLAPALAVAGALVASVAATMLGQPGYGIKEAGLQIVLAAVGVGAVTMIKSAQPAA